MLGETCVVPPPTPPFSLSAFLSTALATKNETAEYASSTTTTYSDQMSESGKKRRRGELSNPANTLDGLVARRADDSREPFQKRFLSEQEAIEGPDDEQEMKKMEKDPDVSTRTCSTCGYQGKWVSEMIRHKRVHTAERPFKCRYCSRTSKWKADLIRHVAKTHGIRVVSKYSRSKTFDPATTLLSNRPEDDKPRAYACEMEQESSDGHPLPPSTVFRPRPLSPSSRRPLSYRCAQCLFEQDGLSLMIGHLRVAHNAAPYECRCGRTFEDIETAMGHAQSQNGCGNGELVVNITPIYNRSKAAPSVSSFSSVSPSGSRSDSSPECSLTNTETEEEDVRKCCICPFETGSSQDLRNHVDGHANAAPFKCVFCSWSSMDKMEIEAHLRLHCQYPPQFMSSIERNAMASSNPSLPSLLSPLDLTAALLLLQQRLAPSYLSPLASPLAMLSLASPSAFTPVPRLHSCDRCEARFRDGSSLTNHVRLHGSKNVFSCPLCDYASSRAANLVLHIQGHHSVGGIAESQPEEPEEDVVDVETD